MKKENADWRLDGYNGNLNGKVFIFKKFVSSDKNDHEHCEFCWKKITNLQNIEEEHVSEGYCFFNTKTGQTNWICQECFNDFKNEFNFKIKTMEET